MTDPSGRRLAKFPCGHLRRGSRTACPFRQALWSETSSGHTAASSRHRTSWLLLCSIRTAAPAPVSRTAASALCSGPWISPLRVMRL